MIASGVPIAGCSNSNSTETASLPNAQIDGTPVSTKRDMKSLNLLIQDARQKYEESIQQRTAAINRFINSRISGVKPFSEECTSLYAKYKTIRGQGEIYIKRSFSEKVFSDAELASVLQQTIENCVKDLEQIENELAVSLEQAIIGETLTEDRKNLAIQSFRESMLVLRNALTTETGQAVASMLATEIVSYLTVQTLTSLGVSGTILVTGTTFSWWTLGASVVLAVGFDYLWNWFDDPAGDIRRETITQLSKLSGRLTSTVQGELGKFLEQRASLWEKIVESK
jgi:hypothetical protein